MLVLKCTLEAGEREREERGKGEGGRRRGRGERGERGSQVPRYTLWVGVGMYVCACVYSVCRKAV